LVSILGATYIGGEGRICSQSNKEKFQPTRNRVGFLFWGPFRETTS
jgi:hypothetical protein